MHDALGALFCPWYLPAMHAEQSEVLLTYSRPAEQKIQRVGEDSLLYLPMAQGLHWPSLAVEPTRPSELSRLFDALADENSCPARHVEVSIVTQVVPNLYDPAAHRQGSVPSFFKHLPPASTQYL